MKNSDVSKFYKGAQDEIEIAKDRMREAIAGQEDALNDRKASDRELLEINDEKVKLEKRCKRLDKEIIDLENQVKDRVSNE